MAARYETYWFEFEAYLRRAGHTIELRRRSQHPHMRLNPAEGVPISDAHFAVAITENDSDVHDAGARVQLVIEKKWVEHYYSALVAQRAQIEVRIRGARWPQRSRSAARHIRLWKPGNLERRELWGEDFAWFAETLSLFRRELGPLVLEARRSRP